MVVLENGVRMPRLGFGVYQIPPKECSSVVAEAIGCGYRLLDTAQVYGNEEAVGEGIRKSGIARKELFLTDKIWISNEGYEKAKKSIDRSLRKLGTDYLDLCLIHQPFGDYYGTYRAMEEAYEAGKIRAIGVSNFFPDRLIDLCTFSHKKPMVNQIECHLHFRQREALACMKELSVTAQGWAPFGHGRRGFFEDTVLTEVAKEKGVTPAQLALAVLLEEMAVVCKTTHKERMLENRKALSLTLTAEEKERLLALDGRESYFFSHTDPEKVKSLCLRGKTDQV